MSAFGGTLKPETAQMVEMSRLAPELEPIPKGGLSRILGIVSHSFLSDG